MLNAYAFHSVEELVRMTIHQLLYSIPAILFVPQVGQHHETDLPPLPGQCYRTAAACDREYTD